VREVVDFVGAATCRYQPRTVELVATSLRSFFRFLRAEGLRTDRLEDAVPMVPHRRSGLVRHLEPGRLAQLIASLDSGSPRGLRDRAIILCMARLGLRASEVTSCGWMISIGAMPPCGCGLVRPSTARCCR
jgi:integrase/recombinase XerD